MKLKITITLVGLGLLATVAYLLSGSGNESRISDQTETEEIQQLERRTVPAQKARRLRALIKNINELKNLRESDREDAFSQIFTSFGTDGSYIVFEAQELFNSPSGKLLAKCSGNADTDQLEILKLQLGVDPLEDIDRIAIADNFVLVEGRMGQAESGSLFEDSERSYFGEDSVVLEPEGFRAPKAGIWSEKLLIVSNNLEDVHQAIGIADGSHFESPEHNAFKDREGSVWGSLEKEELIRLAWRFGYYGDLNALVRENVQQMQFEIDTTYDVSVTVDLVANDEASKAQLASDLEVMMQLLKLKTMLNQDEVLYELLKGLEISQNDDSIRLELEIPLEVIEKALSHCAR